MTRGRQRDVMQFDRRRELARADERHHRRRPRRRETIVDDLETMPREQLIAEARRLRAGIRTQRGRRRPTSAERPRTATLQNTPPPDRPLRTVATFESAAFNSSLARDDVINPTASATTSPAPSAPAQALLTTRTVSGAPRLRCPPPRSIM